MTALRPLHRVHGEDADGVDGALFETGAVEGYGKGRRVGVHGR
jgi:hypothetical protein